MFNPDPSSFILPEDPPQGTWLSGHGVPSDLAGDGKLYWNLDTDKFYQQQGDHWVQVSA